MGIRVRREVGRALECLGRRYYSSSLRLASPASRGDRTGGAGCTVAAWLPDR
jgi:hypothetical protein